MKINFCDLCNESVPESHLSKGKAFLRQGRVICVTCEAAMTSEDVRPELLARPPAFGSSMQAAPRPPALAAGTRTESSLPGWVAVVALLFAVGSTWYFVGELNSAEELRGELEASFDSELQSLGTDLDAISLRAQQRESELEARLSSGFGARHSELESDLQGLRDELKLAREHQQTIDGELTRLAKVQRESEIEGGRRLDDLLAQSLKSRKALDSLAMRVKENEEAQLAAVPVSSPQVHPASSSRYASQFADLRSDTAGTRWNAVQSLGETGDPEVVPEILPLLNDSDVFVRMAVARVCGDLASPLAVEPLIVSLGDEEPVVREAAMVALRIITGRDFGFDPNGKASERAKRIKAWSSWWEKARSQFLGDL